MFLSREHGKLEENTESNLMNSTFNESAIHGDLTTGVVARRFNDREMTLLESFVDANEFMSLYDFSRMLICESLYPPPDLILLFMRQYLLVRIKFTTKFFTATDTYL